MKIKLISFALCPYVHRSTIMLHEKGVPFDIDFIDLSNKPAWFLALSPRGKVPVLLAEGVTIFESAVINEFLDETHPPRVLPDDPFQRAVHRAWVEVANDLFAAQYKIVYSATSKDEYQAAVQGCQEVMRRFESAVRGPFFAGEQFGLVDAAAAPALYRFAILDAHAGGDLLAATPKVAEWTRQLSARRSVVDGVVPEFSTMFLDALRKRGGYLARELLPAA